MGMRGGSGQIYKENEEAETFVQQSTHTPIHLEISVDGITITHGTKRVKCIKR